jgi:formylglycine-generating enzyme required for sulfatase activity
VRARDWEAREHDADFLLVGTDLREAASWLTVYGEQEPKALPEHRDFIAASLAQEAQERAEDARRVEELRQTTERAEQATLASRDAANHAERQRRRARIAIGIAGVIIVVALIAGLIALNQVNKARADVAFSNMLRQDTEVRSARAQVAAIGTLGYVQNQGTQVAAQATYFGIEQARIGTLSAGAVVIPPGTLTPELLLPTLTGIAQLRQWEPRIIVEEIKGMQIEMVEVPPGCFMMGSVAGGNEVPIHEQCFDKSFYIDRYEVTQAQFIALDGVMVEDFAFSGEDRPVETINWFEARDFCAARGARLPTEREWEYAARGPDSLTYPWSNVFVPENIVYNRVESQGTADVVDEDGNPARPNGASWVGAMDLIGNVYEFTSTRFDDLNLSQQTNDYQGLFPYPYVPDDGREEDETLSEARNRGAVYGLRVVRGGSWILTGTYLRAAARSGYIPASSYNFTGFRCARSS